MQQLSAGGGVAEQIENRAAALARFCSSGLPRRLLGPPWLARSVRVEDVDRAPIRLFGALEKQCGLHTRFCFGWRRVADSSPSASGPGSARRVKNYGREW